MGLNQGCGLIIAFGLAISLAAGCTPPDNNQDKAEVQTTADVSLKQGAFEGDISARAAALGDGPYKIGSPVNGYGSDFIKEAFDHYNFESVFAEDINKNADVCDFTKVALFSDKIDLSDFYWHHPDAGKAPLEKLDTHTYRLSNESQAIIRFNYSKYFVGRDLGGGERKNNIDKHLHAPYLNICDLGSNPVLGDIKIGLSFNRSIKRQSGRCASEYQWEHYSDNDYYEGNISSLYKESAPGSTIGFFIHQDEVYIVSMRLFRYFVTVVGRHGKGTNIMVDKEIKVAKIDYNLPNLLKDITPTCSYYELVEIKNKL